MFGLLSCRRDAISCIAKSITESAGIKAEVDEEPSPVIIFIARDHNYTNKNFSKLGWR